MIRQLQYRYANSKLGQQKKSLQLVYWILFVLFVWFTLGMIFKSDKKEEVAVPEKVLVDVAKLTSKNIMSDVLIYGHTEASEKVNLKTRISGVVEKINKQKGEFIKKGEPIITLKMEDRLAQLNAAQSAKDKAEIEYNTAISLLDQGLISRVDFVNDEAKFKTAKASLEQKTLDVNHTVVRAPFDGVIDTLNVEAGSYVTAAENIGVFLNLSPIKIKAEIPEKYIARVNKGVVAKVILSNGEKVDALLTYVGAVADTSTRTFAIELEAQNKNRKIVEGLTAELQLPLNSVVSVELPVSSCLTFGEDGTVGVKTMTDDNIVEFYPVEIVKEDNGGLWVTGLPKQVNVIVAGGEFVRVGEEVKPNFVNVAK